MYRAVHNPASVYIASSMSCVSSDSMALDTSSASMFLSGFETAAILHVLGCSVDLVAEPVII